MSEVFKKLDAINVNDYVDKKGSYSYLSWSDAWRMVKQEFDDVSSTVYENADGWNYHHDGRTAWVKTGVTINGVEHIEYLPIMDNRNRAIPLGNIDSRQVNDTIQRSITKAFARHGLGLYIYRGESLPKSESEAEKEERELLQTKYHNAFEKVATDQDEYGYDELAEEIKTIKHSNSVIKFIGEQQSAELKAFRQKMKQRSKS